MIFADYLVPQIVFVGDSHVQYSVNLTNGIIPRLQNEFQRQYDVINRGFAGYNSEWISEVIDPIFSGLSIAPIDYAVVILGNNDAANNSQHVDIDDFTSYLSNILDTASSYANNTILVGPALVNEDLWPDRSNVDFYQYSEAAKSVAEGNNVTFVDLWTTFHEFFNETTTFPVDVPSVNSTNLTAHADHAKARRDAPQLGYIAGNDTTLNDTVSAANLTEYPAVNGTYIGKKGNPRNALLSQVLIDGLHFNNRGYDIFYKALIPFFNTSSGYYPLPDWQSINGTDYLDKYLGNSYAEAISELPDYFNVTAFGNYSNFNLTNVTIGNVTYSSISVANLTNFLSNNTVTPGYISNEDFEEIIEAIADAAESD